MSFLTKEWLKAARADLKTIGYIIDNEDLTSVVSFHSEQSIEKSFKALLADDGKDIPKIHDIRRLHKMSEPRIKLDERELKILLKINELYVESRYPGDMGLLPYGKPTLQDAREFYEFALKIFDKVCKLVNIDQNEFKGTK